MKARRGQGTVYRENDPKRRQAWRAENLIELPDGTRKRVIVRGRTKRDAEAALELRLRALERANPEAEKQRLDQFIDAWLEERENTGYAAKTIAEWKRVLRFVKSDIGHLPLARVRPAHINSVVTALIKDGKVATADRARQYTSKVLDKAVRLELLAANPAAKLEPVRQARVKRVAWEPWEARAFLERARRMTHGGYYALFYAALMTGMRRGELLALQWADVTESSVHVVASFGRHGMGPVKTKAANRFIPITRETYLAIAAARAELPASDVAFPNANGDRLDEGVLGRRFRSILKKAHEKDKVRMLRFHDLRRTTATWWAASGVPPRVIQHLMGHTTPTLALAIYTDVMEGQAEGAALDPDLVLRASKSGGAFGGKAGVSGVTRRYS